MGNPIVGRAKEPPARRTKNTERLAEILSHENKLEKGVVVTFTYDSVREACNTAISITQMRLRGTAFKDYTYSRRKNVIYVWKSSKVEKP